MLLEKPSYVFAKCTVGIKDYDEETKTEKENMFCEIDTAMFPISGWYYAFFI